MKTGARGQVTIPRDIRLKKAPAQLNLSKWNGRCGDTFAKLGYSADDTSAVDKFIEDVRGR